MTRDLLISEALTSLSKILIPDDTNFLSIALKVISLPIKLKVQINKGTLMFMAKLMLK